MSLIGLSGCESMAPFGILGPSNARRSMVRIDDMRTARPLSRIDTYVLQETSEVVGELAAVEVAENETLLDIARRYDIGYQEILDANPGVDPWLPPVGERIVLPTRFILPNAPRTGIVLNLASMRLFYFPVPQPGETARVVTHPVGIGREGWQTPKGLTKIVKKVEQPSWNVPASIRAEHAAAGDPLPAVVPPGPDNPLGEYAMRLSIPSYLIHGTNKPAGIGMRVSHGCIQLYPEDIRTLFDQVPTGTEVRIVNQPYLAGWHNGVLHLEIHSPLAEENRRWGDSLQPLVDSIEGALARNGPHGPNEVDWTKAEDLAQAGYGIPVPIAPETESLGDLLAAIPLEAAAHDSASDVDEPVPPDQWFVRAGSFKVKRNAKRLAAMIKHLGPNMPARHWPTQDYHQVLVGPFESRAAAEKSARKIRSSLSEETVIVPPGSL